MIKVNLSIWSHSGSLGTVHRPRYYPHGWNWWSILFATYQMHQMKFKSWWRIWRGDNPGWIQVEEEDFNCCNGPNMTHPMCFPIGNHHHQHHHHNHHDSHHMLPQSMGHFAHKTSLFKSMLEYQFHHQHHLPHHHHDHIPHHHHPPNFHDNDFVASRDSVKRPLLLSARPALHALCPIKCRPKVASALASSASSASALCFKQKPLVVNKYAKDCFFIRPDCRLGPRETHNRITSVIDGGLYHFFCSFHLGARR